MRHPRRKRKREKQRNYRRIIRRTTHLETRVVLFFHDLWPCCWKGLGRRGPRGASESRCRNSGCARGSGQGGLCSGRRPLTCMAIGSPLRRVTLIPRLNGLMEMGPLLEDQRPSDDHCPDLVAVSIFFCRDRSTNGQTGGMMIEYNNNTYYHPSITKKGLTRSADLLPPQNKQHNKH